MTGTNAVATTTSYMHGDHLGSTNVVTDENGTVVQTLDYYPYGSERIDSGADVSDRQFIGERFDEETDLSYLNARYYSGDRGQFLSQDPVFWEIGQTADGISALTNPQLQNSYSYAANNPITNKDPNGRFLDTIADLGFIAYDLYRVGDAYVNGGNVNEELAYLGADAVGALVPFGTGFGVAARTAKIAKDAKYSVYTGKDASEAAKYVGITGRDPAVRAAEHLQAQGTGRDLLNYTTQISQLTKTQARQIEQGIIDVFGLAKNGGQLLNKINSISPSNTIKTLTSIRDSLQKVLKDLQKSSSKSKTKSGK